MASFCEQCRSLLIFDNKRYLECPQCNIKIELTPEKTLMIEWKKPTEEDRYRKLVQTAIHDPTLKKINEKCDKCNENYKVLHLGDKEFTVKLCSCGKKF